MVILLALRWMELEIPPSKADGKNWWNTVDPDLTFEELSGQCMGGGVVKTGLIHNPTTLLLFSFLALAAEQPQES